MYDSILVATDGSRDASIAIDHAVELASRLEIPVHGIAVVEERTAYDNAIVEPDEVKRRLRSRAEESLEELAEAATAADIRFETTVRSGVPHEEILEYVDERDVGAIVVGARGESAFRRALLGSTVDAIVRLSPVPVLVVGDEAERAR